MKTLFFAVALLFPLLAHTQTTIEYLDINNVKAGILNRGDMFWEPGAGTPKYEFPKGSGKHSNFAGALWVSGVNQASNNLHVSAQTYRQTGNDYWTGPLDANAQTDSLTSEKWDKIWKVNKTTIDSFINTTTHTPANTPQVILQWPSKGNVNAAGKNGVPLNVTKQMAPFKDVNNDGIYNALDGDYPEIKGEQALWWVFNDYRPHGQTGSTSMRLEIKAMAYACKSVQALTNAIYVEYSVVSLDSVSYTNSRFSLYEDIDIGYAFDDYIACDTFRRMAIGYNGDNFDDTTNGYGAALTQAACIVLKSPQDSVGYKAPLGGYVFYNNDATNTGNPVIDTHYAAYMHNRWKDGLPYTDACNARDLGAGVNYVYPDEPNIAAGWSERQCNNIATDRRFLLNTGDFVINPGIEYQFHLAFLNTPVGTSNLDFSVLKSYADTVMQYPDGCSSSWPLNTKNMTTEGSIHLFPNPAHSEIEIKCDENTWQKTQRIEIFAADGKVMRQHALKGKSNQKIDIGHFAKGLYFMKIVADEKIYTERFFKD